MSEDFDRKTAVALSIRQPWAWLILNGGKDIENRTWPTQFRGWVLLHASKSGTKAEYTEAAYFALHHCGLPYIPEARQLEKGGIVGMARIVDCVTESESQWFQGKYGFALKDVKPVPFMACKGRLGFFKPEVERWTV